MAAVRPMADGRVVAPGQLRENPGLHDSRPSARPSWIEGLNGKENRPAMLPLTLELAGLGFLVGLVGAVLGQGGGIFIVPALTMLFGMPIRTAVAASLMGIIATSIGVGCVTRPGRLPDLGLAMRLEIATTAGALAGSVAAGFAPARLVTAAFAVIVLATAMFIVLKGRMIDGLPAHDRFQVTNWPAGLAASGLAGAISGLTGVGGGFIKVPVMAAVMHVPFGVAAATSSFMVGITAAASGLVYMARGDVHPVVAAPLCLGAMAGAAAGGIVATHIPVVPLRRLLVAVLVVVAGEMAWRAWAGTP